MTHLAAPLLTSLALALTLASTPAAANSGPLPLGPGADPEPNAGAGGADDWKRLDAEIASLAETARSQTGIGPNLRAGALLRSFYVFTNDPPVVGSPDLSGWFIDRAQFEIEGTVEDYLMRIQIEAAGGSAVILDAFASFQVGESLRGTMGNFRTPFLWESALDDSNLLFLQRTDAGELFYTRQPGAMLSGEIDLFHFAVALQNGVDGPADDLVIAARAGYHLMGNGVDYFQGAYGSDDEAHLSIGAGYFDDAGVSRDGTAIAVDVQFVQERFSVDAHIVDYDDDGPGPLQVFPFRANSLAAAVTLGYMLVEDTYELALRWQDTDNIDQDRSVTLGVNRYVAGHNLKWQLNVVQIESDVNAKDGTSLLLGLNARF